MYRNLLHVPSATRTPSPPALRDLLCLSHQLALIHVVYIHSKFFCQSRILTVALYMQLPSSNQAIFLAIQARNHPLAHFAKRIYFSSTSGWDTSPLALKCRIPRWFNAPRLPACIPSPASPGSGSQPAGMALSILCHNGGEIREREYAVKTGSCRPLPGFSDIPPALLPSLRCRPVL